MRAVAEAYKETGVERSHIRKCCKGNICTFGGFIFFYNTPTRKELDKRIERVNSKRNKLKIEKYV